MTFIEAIARAEGFGIEGSRAQRNKNPGNMNFGPFAEKYGAVLETGATPRFAVFPSIGQGWQAMRDLLVEHYADLTVAAALNKWAPPVENQTNSYIANVVKWTGMNPDDVLTAELIG